LRDRLTRIPESNPGHQIETVIDDLDTDTHSFSEWIIGQFYNTDVRFSEISHPFVIHGFLSKNHRGRSILFMNPATVYRSCFFIKRLDTIHDLAMTGRFGVDKTVDFIVRFKGRTGHLKEIRRRIQRFDYQKNEFQKVMLEDITPNKETADYRNYEINVGRDKTDNIFDERDEWIGTADKSNDAYNYPDYH